MDNRDATTEPGEPTCAAGHTVWYRFTPAADALVQIDANGSNFSPDVGIFAGTAVNGLTQLACSTFFGSTAFTVNLRAGTTYYIQAGGLIFAGLSNLRLNVTTASPPFVMGLDCGNGVGVNCTVSYPASGALDVAVKIINQSGAPRRIASFNFEIYDSDTTRLATSATVPTRDAVGLPGVFWVCTPAPRSNVGRYPAPAADSFLSCFDSASVGESMAPGSMTGLGVVHYNLAAATGGTVHLVLSDVAAADEIPVTLLSCDIANYGVSPPAPPFVSGPCVGVDIIFAAPTATPTSTPCGGPCATPTPTNTPCTDSDCDGVPDLIDNCPSVSNANQANRQRETVALPKPFPPYDDSTNPIGDSVGDACDADIDHDGLPNAQETASGTSPYIADSDGDRTNDGTEVLCGSDPLDKLSNLTGTDTDHDGLPDACEALYGTNPNLVDSDGDRALDGVEVRYWMTNPLAKNSDGDNCTDNREIASGNDDRKVNSTDQLLIAKLFGSLTPDYGDLDTNGDGKLNSTDQLFVAMSFGICTPG